MKNLIESLGELYNSSPCNLSEIPLQEIKNLQSKIKKEFQTLPCKVEFQSENEKLSSFLYIKEKFESENVLYVSEDFNESEIFPNEINLYFRAWHDYIHVSKNYPFGFDGEFRAFLIHSENVSTIEKQILFSEIVMQTAFFAVFGKFADVQKVVILPISIIDAYISNITIELNRKVMFGGLGRNRH